MISEHLLSLVSWPSSPLSRFDSSMASLLVLEELSGAETHFLSSSSGHSVLILIGRVLSHAGKLNVPSN